MYEAFSSESCSKSCFTSKRNCKCSPVGFGECNYFVSIEIVDFERHNQFQLQASSWSVALLSTIATTLVCRVHNELLIEQPSCYTLLCSLLCISQFEPLIVGLLL